MLEALILRASDRWHDAMRIASPPVHPFAQPAGVCRVWLLHAFAVEQVIIAFVIIEVVIIVIVVLLLLIVVPVRRRFRSAPLTIRHKGRRTVFAPALCCRFQGC